MGSDMHWNSQILFPSREYGICNATDRPGQIKARVQVNLDPVPVDGRWSMRTHTCGVGLASYVLLASRFPCKGRSLDRLRYQIPNYVTHSALKVQMTVFPFQLQASSIVDGYHHKAFPETVQYVQGYP